MVLRRRGEDDDEVTQGETRRNERWKSLLVDITIIKQTMLLQGFHRCSSNRHARYEPHPSTQDPGE
jgi:hypothetical protein